MLNIEKLWKKKTGNITKGNKRNTGKKHRDHIPEVPVRNKSGLKNGQNARIWAIFASAACVRCVCCVVCL